MAMCMKYPDCRCPELYEVKDAGDVVASSNKKLEQYCFYCMATPRIRRIGHKASWSGSTPKWCPKGREENDNA